MGRKGWWRELVTNEYEKTQTNYGDFRALEKEKDTKVPNEYKRSSLQEKCSQCGKTYWIDKGCTFCKTLNSPSKSETPFETVNIKIKKEILCPKCGSPMKIRTARKGIYTGRRFLGCSRYPSCKGIQSL